MNSVNTEGINEVANSIKKYISNLDEGYNAIKSNLAQIDETVTTLKSWDKEDASNQYTETVNNEPILAVNICKDIWNIKVSESETNNSLLTNTNTNISNLEVEEYNLENLNESLIEAISLIEAQLGIEYNGNFNDFMTTLKSNSAWEELKQVAKENENKKLSDNLYNKFISTKGEEDYVDYALNEIGNKFLLSTYSTKYAIDYMNKNSGGGASPSDEWCAEFVSYIMNKTGNSNTVTPYINTAVGASEAQSRASQNIGEWHSSSDTTYQPQRGDIFYNYEGKAQHTGIVLGSDENYIYTIEGNTSADDGTYYVKTGIENNKGGCVNTRVRSKDYVQGGYYTPPNNCYLNEEKLTKSTSTTIDNTTLSTKLEIDSKYETLKEQGDHTSKNAMG